MPFVRDVSHEEGVVEGDGIRREDFGVVEEGGFEGLNFERRGLPVGNFEEESVEACGIGAGRVANAAVFKEAG